MKKIVFVNGVFDILHRGHMELFKYARSLGDVLYVAVDGDDRVKYIKGPCRPLNAVDDRVFLLESIRYIDKVFVFNSIEELRELHRLISPDILVKGSDWNEEAIRKSDGVMHKTKIIMFKRIEPYSTSSIIEKSRKP